MRKLEVGYVSGRLTVLARTDFSKRSKWLVRCQCGTEKEVAGSSLLSGTSRSCGCLRREMVVSKNTTHGGSKDALYRVWLAIIDRCTNPDSPAYENYGGRGIRVCKRWLTYENFRGDVGPRPTRKYTLDRRNNDGDYSKRNVRWATSAEQNRNTRRNFNVTYNGKTQCVFDWAKELGMSPYTLLDRLKVQGLPVDQAFTKPVGRWAA